MLSKLIVYDHHGGPAFVGLERDFPGVAGTKGYSTANAGACFSLENAMELKAWSGDFASVTAISCMHGYGDIVVFIVIFAFTSRRTMFGRRCVFAMPCHLRGECFSAASA